MPVKLRAEHGVVCALPRETYGYFGWPTVARMEDGTLVAVASGMRHGHVDPFGRTTFHVSRDDGRSWSSPRVITDTPLDDRDAGVTPLEGEGLLVSWFTSDTGSYFPPERRAELSPEFRALIDAGLVWQTDGTLQRWLGSWVRVSHDAGETWQPPVQLPVTAPHGPIRLRSGALLYLGKVYGQNMQEFTEGAGDILAMRSDDGGRSWAALGTVPCYPGTVRENYHEPHVVELPSGKLIGAIRVQDDGSAVVANAGVTPFSILMTASTDGGQTWTTAQPLNFHGSPPHLLRHSSGVLVMSYGYRQEPYGERIALSDDEGQRWQHDYILRDDAPDWDLGYPASVETADGSILTIYYQKPQASGDKCALLWSRWRLP